MKAKNASAINAIIDEMVPDSVPLTDSKAAISHIAKNLGNVDNETALSICQHAI